MAVTGTRNAGNNKWLKLDKTYPIPENCLIDKIDDKFEGGILTITMPKQITGAETAAAAAAETAVAAPPPKEPEQPTPEISPETAATPETKTETKAPEEALPKDDSNSVKPADDGKGKSAELQKQASAGAKEEAPPQGAAAAEKGPAQGDSGEPKTTSQDEKIGSPDEKPTEKREIENQNPEQGKESKTEEVVKNQEERKVGTGAPSPTGTTAAKFARGVTVGRMPSPAMASLAAATVIAVAAYFAYVYYGLLATK